MGRWLTYLFFMAGMFGICAVSLGQQQDFDILVADPIPVIDGKIDDVWNLASKQEMKTDTGEGPRSDAKDCGGYFQALHDSDYLYVLIDVNDSELYMDSPLADGWQDDSAEFYFDGDNTKAGAGVVNEHAYQYRFNWNPDVPDNYFYEYFHRPDSLVGVEYMMAETQTGYRFEIKFPWSTLMGKAGIPMGKLVGIDCYIDDDDDGGGRNHQVAWHSTDGTGWNTPAQWGTAFVVAPLKASGPDPKNGAVDVQMPLFKWVAGKGAFFHNVYLGTTPDLGPEQLAGPRQVLALFYYALGLQPGATYYWRVDEIEKDGVTIHPGDVWSFMTQALTAYRPEPADGANAVALAPTLTWLGGKNATAHHLFFGDSLDAVTQGAADTDKGVLTDKTFAPGDLQGAKTYYWRVDETVLGGAIVAGPVWSFATWLPIENCESYGVEEGTRIFDAWVDGWATNSNGSQVGYVDAPFTEQAIVHGGTQSMPFDYNNVNAPFYSEAELEFAPVQDWTAEATDTLVLYVRGKGKNDAAPLYVGLKDGSNHAGVVTHPDVQVTTATKWVEWKIPLSEFEAAGVTLTAVKKLIIGVGDKENAAAGGKGLLYIDDIVLTKPVVAGQ